MAKIDQERFSSFGISLFSWEKLMKCTFAGRWLFVTCLGDGNAKRSVPGLWPGNEYAMAAAISANLSEACTALDDLIVNQLVSYDQRNMLVRILDMPDAFERPHTFQAISSMWNRFRSIRQCPQRDAHVPMLKWMLEQGKVNEKMQETWRTTFGTIRVPDHLPLFGSPSSNDTSTSVQPSLFAPREQRALPAPPESNNLDLRHYGTPLPLDQDPDQDLVLGETGDRDRPAHLRIVSDAEIARAERDRSRSDLWDACRAAGGDLFAPKL